MSELNPDELLPPYRVITLLDDAIMLAPKQNVDYRNLSGQPTPEDFFLLSRIRGSISVEQVCALSGLSKAKTLETLERLISLGLVEVERGRGDASVSSPVASRPADAKPPSQQRPTPQQPVSKPTQQQSVSQTVSPVSKLVADQVAKPQQSRKSHSSFAPIIDEGSDDELFESDSPAHLSKIRAAVAVDQRSANEELFGGTAVQPEADDLFGGGGQEKDHDLFGGGGQEGDVDLFGGELEGDDDLFSMGPGPKIESDRELFQGKRADSSTTVPAGDSYHLVVSPERSPESSRAGAKTPVGLTAVMGEPDFGGARFPVSWSDFQVDDSVMKSGLDLSLEFKREILFVHSQLEQLSHYDLVGGEPDGDAKSFKKTYIKLSKKFHPDVFYGKDAGEFKSLSKAIFKAVTKAYQTLSNSKKREEYDASLEVLAQGESSVSSGLDTDHRRQLAFQTLVRRGYALEEAGDFGLAVNEYRRALGIQRDDALLLRCGTLLLHAGLRLDEAATYARAVIDTSPGDPEAWLLLGKVYERNNMLESALEAFERAADCAPQETSLRVHVERLRASIG